jgi:hypothetical protein
MMLNSDEMNSTMHQIDIDDNPVSANKRDDLKKDISNIEMDIKTAQKEIDKSKIETYSYATVSPEEANERLRTIVFLRRDLAKKQDEYDHLDPAI